MSVWGAGVGRGTDSAYSPLKVSYRRFSFPRDRPDVRWTKSANRDFFFVLHTPALSGPPPCISTSCSFFKKLGVCCPSQKNIVIYSHILWQGIGSTRLEWILDRFTSFSEKIGKRLDQLGSKLVLDFCAKTMHNQYLESA